MEISVYVRDIGYAEKLEGYFGDVSINFEPAKELGQLLAPNRSIKVRARASLGREASFQEIEDALKADAKDFLARAIDVL